MDRRGFLVGLLATPLARFHPRLKIDPCVVVKPIWIIGAKAMALPNEQWGDYIILSDYEQAPR